MEVDLRATLSLDSGQHTDLEAFLGQRLLEAGEWASPRHGDGIAHLRVVRSEPSSVHICGQLFMIDQSQRAFWLELERDGDGPGVRWTLCFDALTASPRRERNALDTCERADELSWRVTLTGRAQAQGGGLVI